MKIRLYRNDKDYKTTLKEFYEALAKPSKVYSDVLELFTIKMSDLPPGYSENVIRIYNLYSDLVSFKDNILEDFVISVLFHAGFRESDFFSGDDDEIDEKIKEELSKLATGNFYTGPITFEYLFSAFMFNVNEFMKLSNPFERVNVHLISGWPNTVDEKVSFGIMEVDALINGLKEKGKPPQGVTEMNCVIIDPLLNRLFTEKIKEVKKKVEQKLKLWKVLSPEEFMELFISSDQGDFIDLHHRAINEGRKMLEEKYPFLLLRYQLSRISKARSDIQRAVRDSNNDEFTQRDLEDILRRALNGVEGLLLAVYSKNVNKNSRPATFRDILNEQRKELLEDYGEDVYDELIYMNEMRNSVSHPNQLDLKTKDMKKVVGRAALFLDLVELKLKHGENRKSVS